jgi:hypothetical protein
MLLKEFISIEVFTKVRGYLRVVLCEQVGAMFHLDAG